MLFIGVSVSHSVRSALFRPGGDIANPERTQHRMRSVPLLHRGPFVKDRLQLDEWCFLPQTFGEFGGRNRFDPQLNNPGNFRSAAQHWKKDTGGNLGQRVAQSTLALGSGRLYDHAEAARATAAERAGQLHHKTKVDQTPDTLSASPHTSQSSCDVDHSPSSKRHHGKNRKAVPLCSWREQAAIQAVPLAAWREQEEPRWVAAAAAAKEHAAQHSAQQFALQQGPTGQTFGRTVAGSDDTYGAKQARLAAALHRRKLELAATSRVDSRATFTTPATYERSFGRVLEQGTHGKPLATPITANLDTTRSGSGYVRRLESVQSLNSAGRRELTARA